MKISKLLPAFLALLLVACVPGLTSTTPAQPQTPSPTLLPGVSPSDTLPPSVTPSPTPIPEVRVKTADQAFFDGDYVRAQTEYQLALSSATDPQTIAAALWGLGQVEYAAGNNAKALQDLWNLASTYPDSPNAVRAYFIMGEIYMTLERYTEAAEAYTVYLALRPGIIDYYVQQRRAEAYDAAKNYPEAIAAYQAALNAPHTGDDTSLKIEMAQAYASSGDTTTALNQFASIAAASSNDYVKAQMDLLAGQLYLSLGQTDQAYQSFLDAVDNYPLAYDSYSALVTLVNADVPVDDMDRGLVDYFAGQYGYAIDAFQRYLAANPDNDGTAHYYQAKTFEAMGDYQEAVDAYTTFIANYPENRYWQAAWDEKSYIQWADLEQYDEAAQTLLDYANADPGSDYIPQTILSAGQVYARAGRLDDAARTWDSLANNYPESDLVPQALFSAGIARYRNAEYASALASFQRDIILSIADDDLARAYFWAGKTQQVQGDSAAAQDSWKQAAALDPTYYYSLRAQDMLLNRPLFESSPATNFSFDLAAERGTAEAWLRVTFGLPTDTDLNTPGPLQSDPRLIRGSELWTLGLQDEARQEFEELRTAVEEDPANSYRLANYLLDLGLYRPAIFAARQVLTLAGMNSQFQTLAAPAYFNELRYGLYYQDIVLPAASQSGFDPLFLYAVLRQESLFEGFVRSIAGARGLMQIVPSTGQYIVDNFGWPPDYTADDLYRPIVSVNLGAHYLMTNRMYFDGDLFATLAAYNAGPSNAEAWHNLSGTDPDLFLEVIPPEYSETSDYLRSVYEIFAMYRSLYGTLP